MTRDRRGDRGSKKHGRKTGPAPMSPWPTQQASPPPCENRPDGSQSAPGHRAGSGSQRGLDRSQHLAQEPAIDPGTDADHRADNLDLDNTRP